jgi:hypothetical protein
LQDRQLPFSASLECLLRTGNCQKLQRKGKPKGTLSPTFSTPKPEGMSSTWRRSPQRSMKTKFGAVCCAEACDPEVLDLTGACTTSYLTTKEEAMSPTVGCKTKPRKYREFPYEKAAKLWGQAQTIAQIGRARVGKDSPTGDPLTTACATSCTVCIETCSSTIVPGHACCGRSISELFSCPGR